MARWRVCLSLPSLHSTRTAPLWGRGAAHELRVAWPLQGGCQMLSAYLLSSPKSSPSIGFCSSRLMRSIKIAWTAGRHVIQIKLHRPWYRHSTIPLLRLLCC